MVVMNQQGLSHVEISRQMDVSKYAIQALLKKHKETSEKQKCSGWPRKLQESSADEQLSVDVPLSSEDFKQCHQLRTGRTHRDPV